MKLRRKKYLAPPGGLEPPTFRLTAERASQLRHGGMLLNSSAGKYLKIWLPFPQTQESLQAVHNNLTSLRYGLVVRIAGSHPAGPGSIPGNGIPFFNSFPLLISFYGHFISVQKGFFKTSRNSEKNLQKKNKIIRRGWDSNPRGQSPLD